MDFDNSTVNELFEYYRKTGFPNYSRDNYIPRYELRKVRDAGEYEFFNGEIFGKYQSANGFLFSYFPHWIDVQCGGSASLRECWNDDNLLRLLLEKTKTFCEKHGENWSTNRLRQNAKVYCAKQSVSNFNPVTARILYDMLAPGGVVYDMSMGWGGRLLGFHASSSRLYIGCEPSTKTFAGLQALHSDLGNKDVDFKCIGSEFADMQKYEGVVDLAFTSPPYFDTEKYSDEPTQSYIAYPTIERWLLGFIRPTFEICYNALREQGVMAINYADNKNVTSELIRIAEAVGFTFESEYKYELSSIAGKGAKYEPIFIFRKGGEGEVRTLELNTLF